MDRHTAEREYRKHLADWQHTIADLKTEAETRGDAAREGIERRVIELERKSADLGRRLEELQDSGVHAWAEVKAGVDMALDDLRDGVRAARDTLTSDKSET